MAVEHDLPTTALAQLGPDARAFLAELSRSAEREAPTSGEGWQALIFNVAKLATPPLAPGAAFRAIYAAFLGRPNGPRAGWLLASLDPAFVVHRLHEAAMADTLPA